MRLVTTNVIAVEDCAGFKIERELFLNFLKKNPGIKVFINNRKLIEWYQYFYNSISFN